ncbi:MAG TPA: hypothetical protein VFE78_08145 [Gemmataceae bacterium]|nr:hypothetical protein [Gemmataceae bacterium]
MADPDPKRIGPVLDAIRAIWEKCPDCRLGQLLVSAACRDRELRVEELFFLDDTELVERLRADVEEALRVAEEYARKRLNPG